MYALMALPRALEELGKTKAALEGLNGLPLPADDAASWDAFQSARDDLQFEARLGVSRALKHLEVLATEHQHRDTAMETLRAENAKLLERVAALETKERQGPILAAQFMAEAWSQHQKSAGSLGGSSRSETTPRGHVHAEGAPCLDCLKAQPTGAPKGACVHRQVLASGIIDKTFDEHKKLLRQRLADAEAEIQRLRGGEALNDLRAANEALKQQLIQKDEEMRAVRAECTKVLLASQRLKGGSSASRPEAAQPATAKPSGLETMRYSILAERMLMALDVLAHATIEAKVAMLMDDFPAPPAPPLPPPPRRVEEPAREPTPPDARPTSSGSSLPPPPFGRRAMQAQREERIAAPTSSMPGAAPGVPVGGSGICSKPLHPRPTAR